MQCAPQYFEKVNMCEIISEHTGFRCRFCKINNKGVRLGGPAVQYLPGQEFFDGNCLQNKDLSSFDCGVSVVESYNRICPCI